MSSKFKNVHLFRLLSRTSSTQAQINTNLKPFSEVPAPGKFLKSVIKTSILRLKW